MFNAIPKSVEIGEAVIYQKVQDEAVLLELGTQKYFGLDDVAAEMWRLLLEHGEVENAIAALCSIYDADEDQLRADVHALVHNLLSAKLLRASPPA